MWVYVLGCRCKCGRVREKWIGSFFLADICIHKHLISIQQNNIKIIIVLVLYIYIYLNEPR